MSYVDHYKITHKFVSTGIYTYEEILDMLPYERDIFFSLVIEDSNKKNYEANKNKSHSF